jgi:XTP/dITP diphosphohydrolase
MDVYFATQNNGKLGTVQREINLLKEADSKKINIIHYPLDIPEKRSFSIEEISKGKLKYAYKIIKAPVFVMDVEFCVDSLNKFPGPYVNFILKTIKNEGILKLVEDKPRSCYFHECLSYFDNNLITPVYFNGLVPGTLSLKEKGRVKKRSWSKLDLIFIPKGERKTLGEMTHKERDNWSQKILSEGSSSTRQFLDWLTHVHL